MYETLEISFKYGKFGGICCKIIELKFHERVFEFSFFFLQISPKCKHEHFMTIARMKNNEKKKRKSGYKKSSCHLLIRCTRETNKDVLRSP